MTHNPHRVALRSAIATYTAEHEYASGATAQGALARVQNALVACLHAGDEADTEPEVELTTQQELDERRDARWTLDELRHGLAHVLGRRTRQGGIAAAFGMGGERVALPADEILIDDVRAMRLGYDRLCSVVREATGKTRTVTLDSLVRGVENLRSIASTAAEWPGTMAEAIGWDDDTEPEPSDVAEAIATTQATARQQRERAEGILARVAAASEFGDDEPNENALVAHVEATRRYATQRDREDVAHMALIRAVAVLAGHEPATEHVDPEALLHALTDPGRDLVFAEAALAEYRTALPIDETTETD